MTPETTGWQAALLTPVEMAEADRLTIDSGVSGIELMERAGQAVARAAAALAEPGSSILVLCGPGNNGGDGFIAARSLANLGYRISVYLLMTPDSLKGDALQAFQRMRLPWMLAVDDGQLAGGLFDALDGADLVVDALFGAGLDRQLTGGAAALVQAVNGSGKPVLAVDLPSGVEGVGGAVCGEAMKARATITFFRRKPGHLLYPGRGLCGPVEVSDIGIKPDVLGEIAPATFANGPELWMGAWPRPDPLGHKYTRGHAVVFGGAVSSTGAARLAAGAALRAGAGLVTLASPPDALIVNACHLTAVMLKKVAGPEEIRSLFSDKRFNAVLIGPGYGVGGNARAAVETILDLGRASVLDADALTSFSADPQPFLDRLGTHSAPIVLTPHEGEFARLFPDIEGDRLVRARKAAQRAGVVIVLKGPDTVVAAPDGRASINHNAPPFLATAGSGDVLAGIVLALLAEGVPGFEAACQAVWLHGEAGLEAGPGLTAEDLSPALKPVLARLWRNGAREDQAGRFFL